MIEFILLIQIIIFAKYFLSRDIKYTSSYLNKLIIGLNEDDMPNNYIYNLKDFCEFITKINKSIDNIDLLLLQISNNIAYNDINLILYNHDLSYNKSINYLDNNYPLKNNNITLIKRLLQEYNYFKLEINNIKYDYNIFNIYLTFELNQNGFINYNISSYYVYFKIKNIYLSYFIIIFIIKIIIFFINIRIKILAMLDIIYLRNIIKHNLFSIYPIKIFNKLNINYIHLKFFNINILLNKQIKYKNIFKHNFYYFVILNIVKIIFILFLFSYLIDIPNNIDNFKLFICLNILISAMELNSILGTLNKNYKLISFAIKYSLKKLFWMFLLFVYILFCSALIGFVLFNEIYYFSSISQSINTIIGWNIGDYFFDASFYFLKYKRFYLIYCIVNMLIFSLGIINIFNSFVAVVYINILDLYKKDKFRNKNIKFKKKDINNLANKKIKFQINYNYNKTSDNCITNDDLFKNNKINKLPDIFECELKEYIILKNINDIIDINYNIHKFKNDIYYKELIAKILIEINIFHELFIKYYKKIYNKISLKDKNNLNDFMAFKNIKKKYLNDLMLLKYKLYHNIDNG